MTKTHGMVETPTWVSWYAMRQRCLDPNRPDYRLYGGRGISICERWKSFQNFYEDMGCRPEGMTLDRIDSNGNYCPENCRWATVKEQNRNKRNNTLYTHNGETKCVSEWAECAGMDVDVLLKRLQYGWSFSQAVETPVHTYQRMITVNGVTKSIPQWAEHLGIKAKTIYVRLSRGWSTERA